MSWIKEYNYVPSEFLFHKCSIEKDATPLYLGVELEVAGGGEDEENAQWINEALGENNCYIMHDGSLRNEDGEVDGLEITTHPCTLEYHKSLNYKKVFKWLLDNDYRSHDTSTCGLHVHVSRNYLGNTITKQYLNIAKLLYVVEKHWKNISMIARRGNNTYSRNYSTGTAIDMFKLLSYAREDEDSLYKYRAINLTHPHTVELRMFKGTLNYNTFMATLEFVRNLVNFSKESSLDKIENSVFSDIINYEKNDFLNDYYNTCLQKRQRKNKNIFLNHYYYVEDGNDAIRYIG